MWGLARIADTVELVVCELVTNAITHGSVGARRGPIPVVHLDLSTDLVLLRIDVWDSSPHPPVAPTARMVAAHHPSREPFLIQPPA